MFGRMVAKYFFVILGGEFLLNHIKRPEDGRCYFQVTAEGQPIKMQRTIFTECFYVIAMAELARASNLSKYRVRKLTQILKLSFN